jgi:hypothetical protein
VLIGADVIVYTVTDQPHQSDIMRILSNPDASRIYDVPPAKPKANEVYIPSTI